MDEERGTIMATRKRLFAMFALMALALMGVVCVVALPALAQQDKLGKVTFPTSWGASVQPQFGRGVAMLHSYWFIQARKTFEVVLQQDPTCAIAYWGIAVDLLGNTLAATRAPRTRQG